MVNAGSLNETEQERGIAHVVEVCAVPVMQQLSYAAQHCVFRGTKSFADGEIEDFMAAMGAAPGADNNAFTYPDTTQYKVRAFADVKA